MIAPRPWCLDVSCEEKEVANCSLHTALRSAPKFPPCATLPLYSMPPLLASGAVSGDKSPRPPDKPHGAVRSPPREFPLRLARLLVKEVRVAARWVDVREPAGRQRGARLRCALSHAHDTKFNIMTVPRPAPTATHRTANVLVTGESLQAQHGRGGYENFSCDVTVAWCPLCGKPQPGTRVCRMSLVRH